MNAKKDAETVHETLVRYKKVMMADGEGQFKDGHAHGFCNGLEAAIAILEDRPPFFVNADRTYDPYDMHKHPEHFI